MIQRIQTVWLLLVAAFSAVTFRFPFYTGDWTRDAVPDYVELNALTTIWITILTVLAGAIAFVNIFLFDNRKLQLKLCYLGIFITVVMLIVYFLELTNFTRGTLALWCVFHFAV